MQLRGVSRSLVARVYQNKSRCTCAYVSRHVCVLYFLEYMIHVVRTLFGRRRAPYSFFNSELGQSAAALNPLRHALMAPCVPPTHALSILHLAP
jgi:hypothetical protein